MTEGVDSSSTQSPGRRIPLEETIASCQLRERAARPPDFEAENRALVALAQEICGKPEDVLQRLAEWALELCSAHSAGVSILEEQEEALVFRWQALTGEWADFKGSTLPYEVAPCRLVIETNGPLLISRPERASPALAECQPSISEGLAAPFQVEGKTIGTLWVVSHSDETRFDLEDQRVLASLSSFASAAYQILRLRDRRAAELAARERVEERLLDSEAQLSDALERVGEGHRQIEAIQHAEQAFLEQSELLEAVFDNIPVLLCIWDPRLEKFRFNAHFTEVLGWTEEDTADGDFMSKAYPELSDRQRISDYMLSLESGFNDFKTTAKSGKPIDISWANVRLSNDVMVGIGVDIRDRRRAERTLRKHRRQLVQKNKQLEAEVLERKRAEEALRESETRFRAMADAAPAMLWVTESDGSCSFLSRGWYEFTGQSKEEALGYGWLEAVHPDDRDNAAKAYAAANEKRAIFTIDYRLRRVDGEYRWTIDTARPRYGAGGEFLGFIGSVIDVHERKRVEDTLRESEERFRTLADNMSQFAWMAAADGWIFWYNKRWYDYTGTALEDVQGWGWTSVHHPDHVDRVVERIQHSWDTGEVWDDTFPLRGKDGNYRWFLSRALPIRNEAGQVVRWLGTNTDVTEQLAAEEALREADRRKDEFLATLAHELRNPLAPIRTGLELMKRVKDDPEAVEATRQSMERQMRQLVALVDDLLDVSRITRGRLELRKRRVALVEIVRNAVEASQPFIDEAKHRLTVALTEQPVFLHADPHRLAQVLSNLLNNAAKYTPEGGQVELSSARENGMVAVSVSDSGIGIPRAMLESIFEMFSQIERPNETHYTGLGIGLTLVKSIIDMHGGTIEARSDGEDQGSVFTIRLPIHSDCPPSEDEPVAASPEETSSQGRRALLVDDNQAAAEMLGLLVKLQGHEVRTASDGREALEVAVEFRPDVVLMDLGMPNMNGYEAARELRRQPWGKEITLIALTGWGQEDDRRKTKEAGFDFHLVKPADPAELQRLLSRAGDAKSDR